MSCGGDEGWAAGFKDGQDRANEAWREALAAVLPADITRTPFTPKEVADYLRYALDERESS